MNCDLRLIGSSIEEIRLEAFYLSGERISDVISVFLLCSDGYWYRIVVDDGLSEIYRVEEPKLSEMDAQAGEFDYPVRRYVPFYSYADDEILSVKEYLGGNKKIVSCGYLLTFESGWQLSIVQQNENLSLIPGRIEEFIPHGVVVEID